MWWENNQIYQAADMCEYWYDMALKHPEKSVYYFARAKYYNLLKLVLESQLLGYERVLRENILNTIYRQINEKWG